MRVNEYKTLEEFVSQYIGEWGPSDGHWLGLDFLYAGNEYRLHTGSMYEEGNTILPNGRTALFGLYLKRDQNGDGDGRQYLLLEEFADMESLLESRIICDTPFKEVIMDDMTELLGQD